VFAGFRWTLEAAAGYCQETGVRVAVTFAVIVSYFAAARELAGCAEEQVELPRPAIAETQLRHLLGARHPRLAPHLARMRLAVNDALDPAGVDIRAGDRVDVLPPVAGGSDARALLRTGPLSVDEAIAAVAHPGAGGIALFLGVVRDHAEQGAVARLDYEAHPSLAEKELAAVLDELQAEHPGTRLCALHRVGALAVGDIAVIVAASAPHRAEAFAACRAAIDRIKQRVPIWKKEWAPDGSALWVNLEP
jgi:molybdopterin synthase catalytic subunit/molybdopterin converting factor small subunit